VTKREPFNYFKTSREIIRLAVMLWVRFPLSLRNVEDLLRARGIGSVLCSQPVSRTPRGRTEIQALALASG
jgi:hypothetical protein